LLTVGVTDNGERALLLERLAEMVRELFDVPDVGAGHDGRPVGLTDCQCADLLTQFIVSFTSDRKPASE
jgi:hypothetical protein